MGVGVRPLATMGAVLFFISFQDGCYKNCPAKTYSVEEAMSCVACAANCVSCDQQACYWCETDLFLSGEPMVKRCFGASASPQHHQDPASIPRGELRFSVSQWFLWRRGHQRLRGVPRRLRDVRRAAGRRLPLVRGREGSGKGEMCVPAGRLSGEELPWR